MTRTAEAHTALVDAARCRAAAGETAEAQLARRFAAIKAKAAANAKAMDQLTGRLAAW